MQPIDPQTELGKLTVLERFQQHAARWALHQARFHAEEAAEKRMAAETEVPEEDVRGDETQDALSDHETGSDRRDGKSEDRQARRKRPRHALGDADAGTQLDISI